MMNLADEASSEQLLTSSWITSWRSNACQRTFCQMGHASGDTAKWCSITSLGTPGMSDGCHANTSAFARRKATSTSSYLGSSDPPIFMVLVGSASRRISLIGPASLAAIRVLVWAKSRCSRGGWLTIAAVCQFYTLHGTLHVDGHRDGALGTRHLDHHVGIVCRHHELGQ